MRFKYGDVVIVNTPNLKNKIGKIIGIDEWNTIIDHNASSITISYGYVVKLQDRRYCDKFVDEDALTLRTTHSIKSALGIK